MMTRQAQAIAGIGAAVLLIGLAAGCTRTGTGADGEGAARDGPTAVAAGATDDLALPIDGYAYTVPETGQLLRARQILIGGCMRRFGFTYTTDPAQTDQQQQNRVKDFGRHGNKRRYGVTSVTAATRYGYHLVSAMDGTRQSLPAKQKDGGSGQSSAARQLVLSGTAPAGQQPAGQINGVKVPKGGCTGEADTKITDNKQLGEADLVAQIARDSYERSLTDPAVSAAFTAWAGCMRAKGYSYPSPRKAGSDFDIHTRTVPAAEIAAAKTDVGCKQQTRLIEVWSAFEIKFQNDQIDRHAEELKEIRTDHDARMKRVAEIIASGP